MLLVHAAFVAFDNAQHAVQTKATFTAAVNEGADPFFRVIVIRFNKFSGQGRVGRQGIVGRTGLVHQFGQFFTLQHINLPGLGVGAAGRAGGQLKHLLQHAAVNGLV